MTLTDEQLREWRKRLEPHRPDSEYICALIDEVLEWREGVTAIPRKTADALAPIIAMHSARISNAALDEAAMAADEYEDPIRVRDIVAAILALKTPERE